MRVKHSYDKFSVLTDRFCPRMLWAAASTKVKKERLPLRYPRRNCDFLLFLDPRL
jgi:hypothetical protein